MVRSRLFIGFENRLNFSNHQIAKILIQQHVINQSYFIHKRSYQRH